MGKVVKHFFLNKTHMHDNLLDIHPPMPQGLDCCFIEIQTLLSGAQQSWSFLQTAYWHKHGFYDSTTVSTLFQNHDLPPGVMVWEALQDIRDYGKHLDNFQHILKWSGRADIGGDSVPYMFFQKRMLFHAPQRESGGDTLETYLTLSYCAYRLKGCACGLKKCYTLIITSIVIQV